MPMLLCSQQISSPPKLQVTHGDLESTSQICKLTDKEPKFLFAPVGDIVQALTVFAKELMELVEEEGKSEK